LKLSKTRDALDAYADGLAAANAGSTAESLRAIAGVLGEFSDKQMSFLVQRSSTLGLRKVDGSAASRCGEVAEHVDLLAKILTIGGAKAEATKDLTSLGRMLRAFPESETLPSALKKLRNVMNSEQPEQQIDEYVKLLKKQMGTAEFDETFGQLAASQLKREHVVAVATSVYGTISKGTSRKDALKYIRKPHDAYMSARRGINATGGRSAA
jgi:hypothetical protein